MRDIIITAAVLAAMALLIYSLKLLTAGANKGRCARPKAEFILFYEADCECIEYDLSRVFSSPALGGFELTVKIVDKINTDDSRRWLEALKEKTKRDFEIITEEERHGTANQSYDKRDG